MTQETLRMQMLAGVITENEYKAIINKEIEDAEKSSLNESMIGGIVGIGAINQIPPRAKESARFFKTFNSQITMDVMFNWRSFYHFQQLRIG